MKHAGDPVIGEYMSAFIFIIQNNVFLPGEKPGLFIVSNAILVLYVWV